MNRNTRTNALNHVGKKYLLKLDIVNFFESIKSESVEHGFKALGFNTDIAADLSQMCTLEGKLVAGFSTSPILANVVCATMDKEIGCLCENYRTTYTRYADDISISSDDAFPDIHKIEGILNSYGFILNESKSQKFKYGQNQYVTGLSIADKKYPRIPKAIKRRLRQRLHYILLYGYHSHICHVNDWDESTDISVTRMLIAKLRNNIKGWIDYINPIEPDVAKQLYKMFNLIETKENDERSKRVQELILKTGGVMRLPSLSSLNKQPIPQEMTIMDKPK